MWSTEIKNADSAPDLFRRLGLRRGTFWIDGSKASFMGFAPRVQLIIDADGASRRIENGRVTPGRQNPMDALLEFVREAGSIAPGSAIPRTIGFLSYELGPFLEGRIAARSSRDPALPLAWFGTYDAVASCIPVSPDNRDLCSVRIESSQAQSGEALLAALTEAAPEPSRAESKPSTLLESPQWDEYAQAIARAQEYIRAGDIYQVNLARRFRVSSPLLPWEVYLRLRAEQPVPYGSFLDTGTFSILSNSPERFLRREGDEIRTEPIKGTRRRDSDRATDQRLARQLLDDPKERAEHIMIVDLERNDLGRLCEEGSVEVSSLLRLESFKTLHHLVSTIEGRLMAGKDLGDILRATFPGGSITGTPKIRATEVIAELEPQGRGPYTGAIVWLGNQGNFDSSIAIRTAIAHEGNYSYSAGGGIVADSDPSREYAECWLKARVFLNTLLGPSHADALLRKAQESSAGANPCPGGTAASTKESR